MALLWEIGKTYKDKTGRELIYVCLEPRRIAWEIEYQYGHGVALRPDTHVSKKYLLSTETTDATLELLCLPGRKIHYSHHHRSPFIGKY